MPEAREYNDRKLPSLSTVVTDGTRYMISVSWTTRHVFSGIIENCNVNSKKYNNLHKLSVGTALGQTNCFSAFWMQHACLVAVLLSNFAGEKDRPANCIVRFNLVLQTTRIVSWIIYLTVFKQTQILPVKSTVAMARKVRQYIWIISAEIVVNNRAFKWART